MKPQSGGAAMRPWTGNGYGALFQPRIGQEVVIGLSGRSGCCQGLDGHGLHLGNPPPWALEHAACLAC